MEEVCSSPVDCASPDNAITADSSDMSVAGLQWWIWLLIGIGACCCIVLIVLTVVFKARSDDEDKESGDTAMGGEGASYFADDGEFDSAVAQPEDNGVYAAAPNMDIDDASAAINYGSLTNVVAESTSPITCNVFFFIFFLIFEF